MSLKRGLRIALMCEALDDGDAPDDLGRLLTSRYKVGYSDDEIWTESRRRK